MGDLLDVTCGQPHDNMSSWSVCILFHLLTEWRNAWTRHSVTFCGSWPRSPRDLSGWDARGCLRMGRGFRTLQTTLLIVMSLRTDNRAPGMLRGPVWFAFGGQYLGCRARSVVYQLHQWKRHPMQDPRFVGQLGEGQAWLRLPSRSDPFWGRIVSHSTWCAKSVCSSI